MADTFGLLALPASATDAPVGDPALGKLGAYLQAVINAELTAAWLALRPRVPLQEQPAVKSVFLHDPDELCLNEKFLPALFIYRDNGLIEQLAEEWYADTTQLKAIWIFPPEPQEKQRPRNPWVNAVAKAIAYALQRWRHPAWFDPGDTDPRAISVPASANSILLAKATQTAPVTYSGAGLDGSIGTIVCSPRVNHVLTTALVGEDIPGDGDAGDGPPIGGPYNITDPIVVTYVDALGRTTTKDLFLSSPLGGDSVQLGRDSAQAISYAFPAQLGPTGAFTVGNAAVVGHGSALLDRAFIEYAILRTWKVGPVAIEVLDSEGRVTDKLSYPSVQFTIEVREHQYVDLTDTTRFQPAATNGAGVDVSISKDPTNGGWVDNASFPDRGP